MKNELLKFWAKTSKNEKLPNAFHPLICHLIDVAVVTQKMWQDVLPNAAKNRINQAFGIEDAEYLVAFIAGLHDLGKCSPPFQLRGKQIETQEIKLERDLADQKDKNSDFAKRLRSKIQTIKFLKIYEPTEFHIPDGVPKAIDVPHGFVTTIELPTILESYSFSQKLAEQIGVLIGGHHGIFPNSDWRKNGKKAITDNLGNEHWKKARRELAGTLAELLNIKPLLTSENAKLDNGTIMILAGLVSVADWIGSDTQFFECQINDFDHIPNLNIADYLKKAEKQAVTALKQLGWLDWAEIEKPKKFFELFPKLEKYPLRGLQTEAIEISKELKTAGIVVIESPMGEGKTEAAMFLADTFNAVLGQRGIYFALPTQATSNQMFGRVEKFLKNRFEKGSINLQLQHGHSSLSAEFDTLKDNFRNIQDIYEECSGGDCIPHVVAAEWFTYRKRGLLAPFGVGTIDQALMAVLQTKHVFVRLFGLAHKTIIIDEVHAYDAYMSTLLERLLEWLAALGSPVILLSATLPKSRRDALIKAYQKGLGIGADVIETASYPRISYAADSTIKVRHINVSTKTQTLHIKKVDDNFIENLKVKLKDDGCVAIICNTVKRSQDIYDLLSKDKFFQGNDEFDGLPKLDLLHSRFRFCDRDEIEKRVRIRFGKQGDKIKVKESGKDVEREVKRPNFAVLVATQIIEQSLDIDFDLMISDLAPIDLLLQRAGRLFRHERIRPSEFMNAELWIIQPEMNEDLPNFGVSEFVYDKHILLRSWLELQSIEQIEIPDEIERLIEAVYDKKRDCFDEQFQIYWDETKSEMRTKLDAKRLKAKACRITDADDDDLFENVSLQLDEDNPEAHKTFQALTRDSDLPSVSIVVLTYEEAKSIDLDAKINDEMKGFLLMREAKISKKGLTNKIIADETLKQKSWKNSPLLRHHRLLKLDENNEIIIDKFKVSLDEKLGILTEKTGGKNE
jgi:CRISPR-associated endonuclease/helicase Cas3